MVLSAEDDMLHGPFDYGDFHLILPVMTDAGILLDRDTSEGLAEFEYGQKPTAYRIRSDAVCEIELTEAFRELHEQVENASTSQLKRYATWVAGCINRGGGCETYEEPIE